MSPSFVPYVYRDSTRTGKISWVCTGINRKISIIVTLPFFGVFIHLELNCAEHCDWNHLRVMSSSRVIWSEPHPHATHHSTNYVRQWPKHLPQWMNTTNNMADFRCYISLPVDGMQAPPVSPKSNPHAHVDAKMFSPILKVKKLVHLQKKQPPVFPQNSWEIFIVSRYFYPSALLGCDIEHPTMQSPLTLAIQGRFHWYHSMSYLTQWFTGSIKSRTSLPAGNKRWSNVIAALIVWTKLWATS